MDRGLRERVRWGNVALATGVAAALAVVVAWPRLAPDRPRVPEGRVVPMGTPAVPRVVGPSVKRAAPSVRRPRKRAAPPARLPRKRAVGRRERRAGEGDGGSRRGRRRPRTLATPTPVVRARPPRAVATPAPAVSAAPVASPTPMARPAPVAPPAPAGAPAPPDPDPVRREFGPEGG